MSEKWLDWTRTHFLSSCSRIGVIFCTFQTVLFVQFDSVQNFLIIFGSLTHLKVTLRCDKSNFTAIKKIVVQPNESEKATVDEWKEIDMNRRLINMRFLKTFDWMTKGHTKFPQLSIENRLNALVFYKSTKKRDEIVEGRWHNGKWLSLEKYILFSVLNFWFSRIDEFDDFFFRRLLALGIEQHEIVNVIIVNPNGKQ